MEKYEPENDDDEGYQLLLTRAQFEHDVKHGIIKENGDPSVHQKGVGHPAALMSDGHIWMDDETYLHASDVDRLQSWVTHIVWFNI